MKSIPNAEQETTISFGREDDIAVIWTSDKTMIYKFDKLVEESEDWNCVDVEKNEEYGVLCKEYRVPKKMLTFRSKRTTGRKMTEEQKQKLAEGFRAYKEKQKSNTL